MKLLVGLGNPGTKYSFNRHNIGFMVIDAIAHSFGLSPNFQKDQGAQTQNFQWRSQKIKLAKPQTYMNLSGESVQKLISYYHIDLTDLIVIHDDIDSEFGSLRIHKKRGHGGQNGIRNIHELLNSNDYIRLKMGVGRPSHAKMDVANHVLQDFSKEEQIVIPDLLSLAIDALEGILFDGIDKASAAFNKKSILLP